MHDRSPAKQHDGEVNMVCDKEGQNGLIYFLPHGLLIYLNLKVLLCCDKDTLVLTSTKIFFCVHAMV